MDKLEKLDQSLSEILGIENEYELLNKSAKTPEEIEKWCTKEDMDEVKRCVHLMKKGYEVQKISVINNLDRYMIEPSANEELFSLIIDSLMDWDDKMQKECGYSFIKPLDMGLINTRNMEKVAKAAVQITSDDDNSENEELVNCWISVLSAVCKQLDIKLTSECVIKAIKDIPGLKNPFPKRKRGNVLVFSVAKSIGENGIEKDPLILKLILSICHDNNYKIRRDGVIFFKEYIRLYKDSLIGTERFIETYLPLIIDFLSDEDQLIQIDAIEAASEILDYLTQEQIEDEFMPQVINCLDMENQHQIEVTHRIAEIFGELINKLSHQNLHLKYTEQFIAYYKEICYHKDESIRLKAVYNLPCMNLLYKCVEKEMDINFSSIYLQFSEDDNFEIRYCAASSLHEAFKIITDDEDTSNLRKCFLGLVVDNTREIILLMNNHLSQTVLKYLNKHYLENFKGRTPYLDTNRDSDSGSKETTPISAIPGAKGSNLTDFSSAFEVNSKKVLTKKNTMLGINFDSMENEQEVMKLPPIYTIPEYECEMVYSDLFQRMLVLINNIRSYTGMWREHVKLIKNLQSIVHLFYMPEIHQCLVPMLMDFIYKGNRDIKDSACECLAKILKYQHHTASREELIQLIQKEMTQSTNWMQRKAFIYFCKYAISYLPIEVFKKYFIKDYLNASQDKVPHVRMEFANAMLYIKPHFDNDLDLSLDLMDILSELGNDPDKDVQEAVQIADYELLQSRKKNKQMQDENPDSIRVDFQKKLAIREKQELEERKKRVEDDEDSKYDMASFLAESKRWRQKAGKFPYRQSNGKTYSSSKSLIGGSLSTLKKLPLGSLSDGHNDSKTPLKKKSTLTSKKSSNNTGFQNEIDFAKQRKNSILIGGSKDDQIKRYHAMIQSNGQQQINGGSSRGAGTGTGTGQISSISKPLVGKPRRNTIMGVQVTGSTGSATVGQIGSNSNGL